VHGHDGLDEITLTGTSTICEIVDGRLNSYFITPEQFGLECCDLSELIGGDPAENAAIARAVLSGQPGPKRDTVVLNAACCLYMSRNNITMRECVRQAQQLLDNGSALAKLEEFIQATNAVAA